MKRIIFSALLFSAYGAMAQNVGINATGAAPVSSAALDIDMANKGMLIPRVALTATSAFAPVTGTATASLMIYNTATSGSGTTAVSPGYYYWDGAQWIRFASGNTTDWKVGPSTATVNTPAATGFLGTSDNNHIDLVTNGITRGRLSNLGELFIGGTTTALAGDLVNGIGNATFPWAINGYSSNNGAGVYGAIQTGTTVFGAVQGEYSGTATTGTGVRGSYITTIAGTSFAAAPSGLSGVATSAGAYKFGVYGNGGTSGRSGGVFGYNYGLSMGALGYYTNGLANTSVYGFGAAFTAGAAAGKSAAGIPVAAGLVSDNSSALTEVNTNIGLGIYGGFMGGWVRGLVYGTHLKGERYSLYVDGRTYVNEPITQLVKTEGDNRQAVYSSSAMKVEVSDRGKASLASGEKYIAFSDEFRQTISSNPDELTITVSPMGNSNGIYILSYDQNGFTVKENNNGQSGVAFNWIAIGTRRDYDNVVHSPEIIASDFDQKMNGVMFNENNKMDTPQPVWWDGTQMRWDAPPAKEMQPGYTAPDPSLQRMTVMPSASPVPGNVND